MEAAIAVGFFILGTSVGGLLFTLVTMDWRRK